ncbi:MAG: 5-methyltetrahydropteroyltriglutamate--homocysteine S-methyltransferase [Campylobacterales bacterium]
MKIWITGYPRIGQKRELKWALEGYWNNRLSWEEVEQVGRMLRLRHWQRQRELGADFISVNDFSYYDVMLDTIMMLGLIPPRFALINHPQERYFAMARGTDQQTALAMRKWLNTNYHYLVPELSGSMRCDIDTSKIEQEYREAKEAGVVHPKINLIGPLTFLLFAEVVDGEDPLGLLEMVLEGYEEVLRRVALLDERVVVQLDEPAFVMDRHPRELEALKRAYERLGQVAANLDLVVMTYFDEACEAAKVLATTPIWAIGLDFVEGVENFNVVEVVASRGKQLIAGVVNGRNVWHLDPTKTLEMSQRLANIMGDRLHLAPSCSLLHLPYSASHETSLNPEVQSWLAFADEKIEELVALKAALSGKITPTWHHLAEAHQKRSQSFLTHNESVRDKMRTHPLPTHRANPYEERMAAQKEKLHYPELPTTTIGSFPQTAKIRETRSLFRQGRLGEAEYQEAMKQEIAQCIAFQEEIGLDVFVHGEFERTDMVEFFGAQLEGVAITENGWVQSYGTRCVKPPIIYGDVWRPKPMALSWLLYAKSLTDKPVKGMLTGPVTILNWSFVRDDQPKEETAWQLAYVIAEEIDDLQEAGFSIIQVDEAAFKEGYPLRAAKRGAYERWAVATFRAATAVAKKTTQIHTHMCYSDFSDIIEAIEALDADVITIETARNGNRLLEIFSERSYPRDIGPGVYDVHSPRVPSVEELVAHIRQLLTIFPKHQLWINPDCGLKTRGWPEVKMALKNMVLATKLVRGERQWIA